MADVSIIYNEENGQRFGVTGPDFGQCTAIPHRDAQLDGVAITYGNAVDIFDNADPNVYNKVRYSGTSGPPPRNAIVVWGQNAAVGTGPEGHVSKANGEYRADQFQSLDQNWPTGAPTGLVWHTYQGVIGWLILKSQGGGTVAALTPTIIELAYNIAYEENAQQFEIDYWMAKNTDDETLLRSIQNSPRYKQEQVWREKGRIAQRDGWEQQIADRDKKIAELQKQVEDATITPEQAVKELDEYFKAHPSK